MEWPPDLAEWWQRFIHLNPELQQRLLLTIAVVVLFSALRKLVLMLVFRRHQDIRIRYRWKKTSLYVGVTVAVFLLGRVWFEGFQSLATFLGILTAGLAIALKELVANFVGWLFIIWRRPFEVGDRIAIGDTAGDVIDIRVFQLTILEIGNWVHADQSTGRIIHINNGAVFTQSLANYSKGFHYIWDELEVLVTFESDWRKAKSILARIASQHGTHLSTDAERNLREAAQRFLIFYSNLTPTVYTSVRDSGVLLTLRFLCEPRRRRGTEQSIWEDVLDAFAEHANIDFAYPTQRFFDNRHEGKPEARAPLPDGGQGDARDTD